MAFLPSLAWHFCSLFLFLFLLLIRIHDGDYNDDDDCSTVMVVVVVASLLFVRGSGWLRVLVVVARGLLLSHRLH